MYDDWSDGATYSPSTANTDTAVTSRNRLAAVDSTYIHYSRLAGEARYSHYDYRSKMCSLKQKKVTTSRHKLSPSFNMHDVN